MANTRFEQIPDEIKLMIFSFLQLRDAKPLFFLNKETKNLLKDNLFWKEMFQYYYPKLYKEFYKELSQQQDIDWLQELREVIQKLKNQNLLNYLDLYLEFLHKKPLHFGRARSISNQFSAIETHLIAAGSDPIKWFDLIFMLRDTSRQLRDIKSRTFNHILLSEILHGLVALNITHLKTTKLWKIRIDALIGNIIQLENKIKDPLQIDPNVKKQIQEEINQTTLKLAMCGEEKYFALAKNRNLFDARYEVTFTYLPEDMIAEQFKCDYDKQLYVRTFETITGLTYEEFKNQSLNLATQESEEITPTHKI